MGFLCQSRDVGAYSDRFDYRFGFFGAQHLRPHSLLDFRTYIIIKRRKWEINSIQKSSVINADTMVSLV